MTDKSATSILEFSKVLGFISKYSCTDLGKKLVETLEPFKKNSEVEYQGTLVSEAKNILIEKEPPPFISLPDLRDDISLSKIDGAVLSAKKLLEILNLAASSRNLFQFLHATDINAKNIVEYCTTLFVDKVFEKNISSIFDESGNIKDSASRELKRIRDDIKDKNIDLQKIVNKISKNLADQDILREEFLTLRDGRVVLPIKAEFKRQIKGFIHSESATGQTVYIEPEETLHLNNELITLSFAEKREIERILKELTKRVGENSIALQTSLHTIAKLDSVFARAHYSIAIIGSFPQINYDGLFEISDARHPILLQKYGREKTVPLSLSISRNKNIIIITGPNAGGKTVALKTIGLLTLMVFSGIPIPASPDSNFSVVDGLFVDIGDQQSLEEDLSTFSSHLSNIKRILNAAGKNSIVLLDELGTGTDPAAGSALGASILYALKEKSCFVLASTHHGNLKFLSQYEECFQNAAMEFDTINLTPTYLLKQGLPGSSYAFEIVKRLGFSDAFISKAKSFLSDSTEKIDKSLIEIENTQQILKENQKQVERENSRLKGLTTLYQQRIEKLEAEKSQILKKAKLEAEEFLSKANKELEQTIKQLRESQAAAKEISSAKKVLANIKKDFESIPSPKLPEAQNYEFKVGGFVKIKNSGSVGKIQTIDIQKKRASVLVGKLIMSVSLADLEPSDKKEEKNYSSLNNDSLTTQPSFRFDIRGKRPDAIENDVIKFIDSAYMNGFDRVEILHGKGDGVLKKMVHSILREHIGVSKFYFAPLEIGGEGITIIEYK